MTGYEQGWQWYLSNIYLNRCCCPKSNRLIDPSEFTKIFAPPIEEKPITQLILNNYNLGG